MVAEEYDGLNRGMERGVGAEAPPDPNGVDVYQHWCCNEGWRERRAIIGEARGGGAAKCIWGIAGWDGTFRLLGSAR